MHHPRRWTFPRIVDAPGATGEPSHCGRAEGLGLRLHWAGRTVAVLGSGADKNHPWLSRKVVSEACFSMSDVATGYSALSPGGVESSTMVLCPFRLTEISYSVEKFFCLRMQVIWISLCNALGCFLQ